MKEINKKTGLDKKQTGNGNKENLPGYPVYPANEDIYSKFKEEAEINPENIALKKEANDNTFKNNQKDFIEDKSGSDLDIPGAELDDEQEKIGNEDEENNYYSLGGDNHNNLDESKGGL